MNATHMMVSQGGMAIAGLLWGALAARFNVDWALLSASVLGVGGALTPKQWSIDFSTQTNLDPEPLTDTYHAPYLPEPFFVPITATIEIDIAPQNHIRFFRLMKQIRLVFLRNGAFNARLDQDIENPNRFRLQAMYSSWAALQRTDQRFTRDENALWSELWTLHSGQESPRPKRYLGIQHWIPEESAMARLKPAPPSTASEDRTATEN